MRKPKPRPAPFSPAPPGGKKNPYRGPAMASDPSKDTSGVGMAKTSGASTKYWEPPKKAKKSKMPTKPPRMK